MNLTLIHVALGGAIGAVLRHMAVAFAGRAFGPAFPWGSFAVNVAGSLAMGFLAMLLLDRAGPRFAPFLLTGILGGFTTFSAFSWDALNLWQKGQVGVAGAYVAGTLTATLLAVALGAALARAMAP